MNEYEIFKKKIYYKIKPPTKKELYEIAIKQEEEIVRLNNIINELYKLVETIYLENGYSKEITTKILDRIKELKGVDKE